MASKWTLRELRDLGAVGKWELALLLGVRVRTLYSLENGRRRPDERHCKQMCELFGVDSLEVAWLPGKERSSTESLI